ncbi:hypothetical protein SNE26_02280 [Mucilaginibacter sp. cycad4]|uniref:hypothetical protein n=1 Tax=Mucilaginibacter sp. cycad4 TaxID=3342096 RepID=UPI002AABD5B1|nr:hypothetical protein [Mucilaginibacter gossypii]WPV00592.1 hypothetical protein SNE26_02280 [Mucilaginibacter gossypii]
MNTSIFLPTLLILHLTGLTIMAGTTIVDFTIFKTFWKHFDEDTEKLKGILTGTSKSSRLIGIGAALLVITGIGMMALTHGVFGEQLWFRIKIGIVVMLILNGIFFGRRQGEKLRTIINKDSARLTEQVDRIKTNLNIFFAVQLVLFFSIVFLSVFKFS